MLVCRRVALRRLLSAHVVVVDVVFAQVAIKAIDKEALTKVNAKENVLKLRREIEIMKKVVHRNIVRLYQVGQL